mmetsp:Transcript_18187/g.37048  ORF Transcript_18187/g.37048 Transcript_18187/m.37048 type:complete len:156 (-) Transcript_18187:183-650(-)
MLAAFTLPSFTLPSRPLATSTRCAVRMGDSKSDRYSFEDPRQILDNFFNPLGSRVPKVFSVPSNDGKAGADATNEAASGEMPDLIQDSCIDWGALSAREVAAAFMMLKAGSKEAAEELLVETLAELRTMDTADWGLMDTQDKQRAAGETKKFSGL